MKILEDKARRGYFMKLPLKCRCPHCDSLLLIEEGDYGKEYNWVYTSDGGRKRCYHYIIYCPCCKEKFRLEDYENI